MLETARAIVSGNIRSFLIKNQFKYNEKVFTPTYSEFRFEYLLEGLSLLYVFGLDVEGVHCRTYLNGWEVCHSKEFSLWSLRQNLTFGFFGFDEASKVVFFEVNLPLYGVEESIPSEEVFVDLFSSVVNYLTGPYLLGSHSIRRSRSGKRYAPDSECPLWVESMESFDPIIKMVGSIHRLDRKRSYKQIGVTGTYITRFDHELCDFRNSPVLLSFVENSAGDLLRFQSHSPYSSFFFAGTKLMLRVLVALDEPVHLSTGSDYFSLFLDAERGRVKLEDTEKWDDLGFDFLSDD